MQLIPCEGTSGFIAIFRPRQLMARAIYFRDEQDFIDAWVGDYMPSVCHCRCPTDEDLPFTFEKAWVDAAHDLHNLTRLDSPEEVLRYVNEPDYAGRHNKGLAAVIQSAIDRNWLVEAKPEALKK